MTDKRIVIYIIILILSQESNRPGNLGILISVIDRFLLKWGSTTKTRLTITVRPVSSNENLIKGDFRIVEAIFSNNLNTGFITIY